MSEITSDFNNANTKLNSAIGVANDGKLLVLISYLK